MHLRHPIEDVALGRPDHPVLVTASRTWTATALRDTIAARAGQLVDLGVEPGETVALVGTPSDEWIVTMHAIRWIGAVAFPLDPQADPAHCDALCEQAGARRLASPHALGQGNATAPPAHFVRPHDPALKIATSGTTGTPRIVTLTHGQILSSALGSAQRLGHDPSDAWLCCLPLHHVGGLSVVLRCAVYGTRLVLHERFDAVAVAAALDSGEVTQVSLVPTLLSDVLDARNGGPFPPSLRVILLGGAPTSPSLLDRCRAITAPVALTWGMSETGSQIATRSPGDLRPDPDVGHPLPGVEVTTEDGHLVVTGSIAPDGRLVTADRGHLDAQGRVVVTGRGTDLIISGGENIDPARVEHALSTHPGITEVAVIGRPDTRWGERPVAICVGPTAIAEDEVRAWAAHHLPEFAVPDAIIWATSLPRTALGKLDRARLRRRFDETQGDQTRSK